MRTPRTFLKIAALSSFILLMSSFVAYRSGALQGFFNEEKKQANNEASIEEASFNGLYENAVDSPPANQKVIIPSSKSGVIMPSSKVLIMTDDILVPNQDSSKRKEQQNNKNNNPKQGNNNAPNQAPQRQYMGGSKSSRIIEAQPDTQKKSPK